MAIKPDCDVMIFWSLEAEYPPKTQDSVVVTTDSTDEYSVGKLVSLNESLRCDLLHSKMEVEDARGTLVCVCVCVCAYLCASVVVLLCVKHINPSVEGQPLPASSLLFK